MKLLKKILSLVLSFSLVSLQARQMGGKATPQPMAQQKIPAQAQPVNRPAIVPQQKPAAQQTSYAQALNSIRMGMPSNQVILNNKFAPPFITFVTSLNLSNIQTQALLEAGINLHATLTDNDQIDKQVLLSLHNSMQAIIQNKPQPIVQPIAPSKPARPASAMQPPVMQKPAIPAQPIPVKSPAAKQQKRPARAAQQPTPQKQQPVQVKPAPPGKPVAQQPQIEKREQLPHILPLADHFATNNLILLLDPKRSETLQTRVGAMVYEALHGLTEKSAPIIMTSNILEIILQIKLARGSIHTMPTVDPQMVPSISALDLNNFNYYTHKSSPLILVIPKEYIRLNLAKAMNFDVSDQAKVCGFNPTVVNPATNLTADNLLRTLQAQQSTAFNQERFIPNLTSMFIPQKRNGELISPEQDTPWLIYISGHGHPAYLTVGPIREQLAMLKPALTNTNIRITDHMGRPMPRSTIESMVKEYESQLAGKSSWPDSQLIPESAHIAGVSGAQFAELMEYFDQHINTAFIYYISCFAGGSNQSFVNETLSSLDVNYIVAAAGVHEATTYGPQKKPFNEFFRLLRMFFTDPEEFVKRKEKRQDPIVKIIKTLSMEKDPRYPDRDQQVEQSNPFVRFPATEFFEATPLTKKTKVLSKTIVKAHEIEKRPIDFSKTPVDLLIINTPRINTTLNLDNKATGSDTTIVIPSPKSVTPDYEALNEFKEIKSNSSLPLFLFNFIHLNGRAYPQTFVINTLTGIKINLPGAQGLPIRNLIIHTRGVVGTNNMGQEEPVMQYMPLQSQDIRTSRIGMNVYIAFELNNNIYQTVFGIRTFDKNDLLRIGIETLKFTATPQQSTNMNALANNFLTSQEITQVRKPITLESIADFIDDKIDKQDPSMAIWSEADEQSLLKIVQDKTRKQKQK